MISKTLTIAFAFGSVVSAAPALSRRQDSCMTTYNTCVAAGTPEVACSCTLTACLGEDDQRNRSFCATATANLDTSKTTTISGSPSSAIVVPVTTSIPGGCNPAHPGSCPTPSSVVTPVATSIPGGCNPAHPGSCPTPSSYATPVATSIPGGCNPAHAGSCPTPSAAQPSAAAPTVAASSQGPVVVDGKDWTITDLIRYCGSDNSGCDYNFAIEANGKTERCTVIRMPGSDAATESWSNQPCTSGSEFTISWGYAATPAPAFAVLTVVDGKELAWFGVPNVNGNPVTPSSPFGSASYGTVGPAQVYTY